MQKVAQTTVDFIVDNFFISPLIASQYSGAKSIAISLVSTGECITTEGAKNIWRGGIGNFLTQEVVENAVGIIKLKFDTEDFITSAWYQETTFNHLCNLKAKITEMEKEIVQIKEQIKEFEQ
jgi:hypothetical protein